jgi:hypothetical protein
MNDEENNKVARLTAHAVSHPSDATIDSIMTLIVEAEQTAAHVREMGEKIISEFRKHTGLLSEQVNDHFARCQKVTNALHDVRVQVFGEDPEGPKPTSRVNNGNNQQLEAIAKALNLENSSASKGRRTEK